MSEEKKASNAPAYKSPGGEYVVFGAKGQYKGREVQNWKVIRNISQDESEAVWVQGEVQVSKSDIIQLTAEEACEIACGKDVGTEVVPDDPTKAPWQVALFGKPVWFKQDAKPEDTGTIYIGNALLVRKKGEDAVIGFKHDMKLPGEDGYKKITIFRNHGDVSLTAGETFRLILDKQMEYQTADGAVVDLAVRDLVPGEGRYADQFTAKVEYRVRGVDGPAEDESADYTPETPAPKKSAGRKV